MKSNIFQKNVQSYTLEITNSLQAESGLRLQESLDLFSNLFVGFYEWNWDFKFDCPEYIKQFADKCLSDGPKKTIGNIYTSYLFALRLVQNSKFAMDRKTIQEPSAEDVEKAQKQMGELAEGINNGLLPGKGSFEIPSRPESENVNDLCKGVVRAISDSRMSKALKNIAAIAQAIEAGLIEIDDQQNPTYKYEYGRDLQNVCVEELVDLASPETRQRFMVKYAKGELLENKETPSKKGLGNLVILKDRSGSTNQVCVDGINVSDMETAIFAALSSFQIRKRFETRLIEFDENILYKGDTMSAKKHVSTEVIKAIGRVPSGGTDFETALESAQAVIKLQKKGKSKTGIIMLTDGFAWLSEDFVKSFNDFKKKYEVRLYSYVFCDKLDPKASINFVSDKIYNIQTSIPIVNQLDKLYNAVTL